jgi:hypothetical protein
MIVVASDFPLATAYTEQILPYLRDEVLRRDDLVKDLAAFMEVSLR